MEDLRGLDWQELDTLCRTLGFPKYRCTQVFSWLHKQDGITDTEDMSDVPKADRAILAARYTVRLPELAAKRTASDGTVKYLWRMADGAKVESVVIRYKFGESICVSTQVGCRMGCAFCASGARGFTRSLAAHEILGQVYAAENDLGLRVSRVTLMGMGEPLDNYENVLRFVRILTDTRGRNISQRHVSLSTSGLIPMIERLTREKLAVTLSISLHAPDDALRSRLMPVNRRYPIGQLLEACDRYTAETGRRVTYEYTLLRDVNDTTPYAAALAALMRGRRAMVNLIPANPVAVLGTAGSTPERVHIFHETLIRCGLVATVRRTLGQDIAAACGQLAAREEQFSPI
jgi:23S rRNA (adenine2503-C2)-methyltransferase